MTQRQETQEQRYLQAFESFQKDGAAQDPSWVREIRQAAISRFREAGFPIARRGNEEWKYTDIGPIARASFEPLAKPPTPPLPADLDAMELAQYVPDGPGWDHLVFVDGRYAEELSSASQRPGGVRVLNLSDAIAAEGDLLKPHLAQHAEFEDNAFTALNTAFLRDGAFVHIPDGALIAEPLHLVFLTSSETQGAVSYPRVLVVAGKASNATIIESYGGLSQGPYFTNAVTEVVVQEGAIVSSYRFQKQSEEAFHVANTQVVLGRDSNYTSVAMDLGGGLVRNNLNVLMGGEGSSCMLNGLYMVANSQHVDNQLIIDHAKAHTTSRELYKGILSGKSRAVFHGSIIVRRGTQKVDAQQADKNLLLSAEAEADTKPAFWIYADDVKCGHGAATGKLDEDALFYLTTRGLDQQAARRHLIYAFASEILDSVKLEPYRVYLERVISAALRSFRFGGA